ncbi:SDR family NAD(P)-dependent oxidoreductase [Anaeromonas gelatinilytica]|uniref:SDR family NAD(P)-dependent oxidoreductase n=1 Tax=Anaeromonas gelatinilytica TaxID=2683194 RepID=UPI0020791929|nr:SDR family NAD(P)-dependent oxidoreductase [Anaeromonas gelatinilytica]
MKNVCVITGGDSGMGLATAKILGKDNYIIIVDRTVKKLENAIAELNSDGIEAEVFACDISDRASVNKLVAHAKELGVITSDSCRRHVPSYGQRAKNHGSQCHSVLST